MSKNPYFSIIIPTYNRRHLIGDTIESALAQTLQDFEIIVVDDGSTDNTQTYIENNFQDKVRLISISNSERGKARNTGTANALGDYIYFLDSDDLLYPNHLQHALAFIESKDNPEWIFQEYEFLDKKSGKTSSLTYNRQAPIKSLVSKGNFLSCHGVFLRRDIALQHPFEENRNMAGSEDYALWLRLAARYPLSVNNKVTSALVQHDARSVFNFSPEKLIKRKELMLEKVLSDEIFNQRFSHLTSHLIANTYSYIALHLAMIHDKKTSLKYLFKSMRASRTSILNRRTLAIFKHLIN